MALSTKFSGNHSALRSHLPLSDDQIRTVAPSIFAREAHDSRSARYAYIPTIEVLRHLQKEGFSPFMVCQSRARDEAKREHTKHMIRMRHASQITGAEANEIILLNSHDGTSSYQMLAGVFRFVCCNGMVCGTTMNDLRVRHNGNVVDGVIDGAFRVVEEFALVDERKQAMKSLQLEPPEQAVFARAALAIKYDDPLEPAPVSEDQLLRAERADDLSGDLWTTFNRVQEHLVRGGLRGRSASGRRITTREVRSIDQNIKINRALWILAEGMRELKAA